MLTGVDTAVILEVALNGTTTRERNPHVPRTPAEVAEQAVDVLDAGAAIVHHHNDEPMFTVDGVHAVEPYLAAWDPVLAVHPDALLYPTMAAGARDIPVERRWAHVAELGRRGHMTLVDPGSVNVGLLDDGTCPAAAAPEPYQNSFADTEYMFARTAELGAAPSISVFEPGFLRTALTLHRHGRVPPGAIVKLYFADRLQFGLPPTRAALEAYLELLEPLGTAVVGRGARRRRGRLRPGRAGGAPRRPPTGRPGGLRRRPRHGAVEPGAAGGRTARAGPGGRDAGLSRGRPRHSRDPSARMILSPRHTAGVRFRSTRTHTPAENSATPAVIRSADSRGRFRPARPEPGLPPAHRPSDRSQDQQDHTDDDQQTTEVVENGDAEEIPHQQQDQTKNDHFVSPPRNVRGKYSRPGGSAVQESIPMRVS